MVFAPTLQFPKPSYFLGKEIETTCSEKKNGTGPRQERRNAVSLPQGDGEAGPDQKTKKNKDTAKNCGGDIAPGIGHAEGDAKEAEKRTRQRISQAIPVLRLVGGAQAIVQAGTIRGEASNIGPWKFVRGEKTGSEGLRRGGTFGQDQLSQ